MMARAKRVNTKRYRIAFVPDKIASVYDAKKHVMYVVWVEDNEIRKDVYENISINEFYEYVDRMTEAFGHTFEIYAKRVKI